MINEKLRSKMEEAYMTGDYEKALHLSQKLDKQIVSAMYNYIRKKINKKIRKYPHLFKKIFSSVHQLNYIWIIILTVVALLSCSINTYAAGDLFGNIQNLLSDVYAKFVGFSTAAAGIGVGTGVFMRKFSFGKQHQIEIGGKIIKDSIVGWAVLNSVGIILSYVSNYTK